MKFGECLKNAREAAGLSQKELGKLLQVPASMIGRYETTNTEPRIGFVLELCKVLKITPNELLNYKQFDPSKMDTAEDSKAAAEYWSKVLNPYFSLNLKNGFFILTALQDISAVKFPILGQVETIAANEEALISRKMIYDIIEALDRYIESGHHQTAIQLFVNAFAFSKYIMKYGTNPDLNKP